MAPAVPDRQSAGMQSSAPPWRTVPLADDYAAPGRRPRGRLEPGACARTLEVAGADLHLVDLPGPGPDAPVVLLVHGLGGRWQHWSENLAGLAEHARVVAVDLPGFGRSAPPRQGYAVDGFADVLAELARRLGLPPVVVVGHSLGALVALRLAHRHPAQVSSVVLAAGTVGAFAQVLGLRGAGHHLRTRPMTVAATLLEVATAGLPVPALVRRQVVARSWLRRLLLWPYLHRPAAFPDAAVALLVDGVGTHGVLRLVRSVARMRVDRWLHEVDHPVLAIGGSEDHVAPLSELAAFARAVPAADVVVLGGSGHMVMLERADAFTDEVVALVDRHPV